MTEFDEILVCGPRVKAADVEVGFAQLVSEAAAPITAATAGGGGGGAGTGWRHLLIGGHIRRLQKKTKKKTKR